MQTRQHIAVIGSGISGLVSAYLLTRAHDVVLFEANHYLGGHTNTVDVTLDGITYPVDVGFQVYNQALYSNLAALLEELNVASYTSDMSFGISMEEGKVEWAGANFDTVFAQRSNILSPDFLLMLKDILRFSKYAPHYLVSTLQSGASLSQLLQAEGYSAPFCDAYLLPMATSIWFSSPHEILKYPASSFIQFCLKHSLLQLTNRPQLHTVQGGAREYVRKIAATLADVRLNTAVLSVARVAGQVQVNTSKNTELFDAAVFATHAPQTVKLLTDASDAERQILSAVRYQANQAYLHTDLSFMPRRQKVWSAWNYIGGAQKDEHRPVCISYWLNKLQHLPFTTPVIVTLNPFALPGRTKIHGRFDYEHPIFDRPAIEAQRQLDSIQGKNNCWFTGAWTGYGFHEDGLKSALRVAADFGLAPSWANLKS